MGPQGHQPGLPQALWTWLLNDTELVHATAIVTVGGLVQPFPLTTEEGRHVGRPESQGVWQLHLASASHCATYLSLLLATCSYVSNQESLASRV